MKFVESRPFADPDAAARKLLDIVRTSIAESGFAWAYTGATNTAFTRAGGSVPEYSAGIAFATKMQWFRVERSGTRIAGWCGVARGNLVCRVLACFRPQCRKSTVAYYI